MWKRRSPSSLVLLALLITVAAAAVPVVALADAADPLPTTTGTETFNADGTVTVALSGTWIWSGQKCTGRYGLGWAVDWWGISTSKTPSSNFSLSGASVVVPTGPAGHPWASSATTTGTVDFAGSIQLPGHRPPGVPPSFFHIGAAYSGEDTNLCDQTLADGTPTGPWSATATYPAAAAVPDQLCVNLYDEHGTAGKSSGKAGDFSPVADLDNSIQTNAFDPTANGGNCVASASLTQVGGGE